MSLKGRLRRLAKEAEGDGIMLRLKDGTTQVFDAMEVRAQMFLAQMSLLMDKPVESPLLDAVRRATPESRRTFEERFGSIIMAGHIIAADYQGGWVESYELLEDGTVEKTFHKGGSEEAIRIKEEARQGGAA